MHAIADESKTMLSRDRPNPAVYLLWMVRRQGESLLKLCSLDAFGVGRDTARLPSLGQVLSCCVVVSVVAVFGLAGVELCYTCCLQRGVVFLYSNICLL
jgi:hypothetical protein